MINLHPYIPYQRVDIDLTTGDYTTGEADGVMALYCNASGTLAIQLVGDTTATGYAVTAGKPWCGYVARIDRDASDAAFQNATAVIGLKHPPAELVR